MSLKPQISLTSFLLCSVVFIFAILLTVFYISAEHIFYWWDYGLYMDIAGRLSRAFLRDPVEALGSVYASTGLDYNYYFAVPLIPFLAVFRNSRLGFVLGLIVVYHIPMLFVLGKIVRRVFPFVSLAFWIGVCAGLSSPALWAIAFRGLPDAGGLLLVGMAVLIHLKDPELRRWQVQLPLIGILCGLSIIFRRHFVYNVAAFFFCVGLFLAYFSIVPTARSWTGLLRALWTIVMKMQVLTAFLVLTLVILAPGLLVKMLAVNYLELYSSYENSAAGVLVYFLRACGVLWLFTGLGLLTAIYDRQIGFRLYGNTPQHKLPLLFCSLFGIVSFLTWVLIPRQASLHYVLHVSLLVVLGISAFFFWAWIRLRSTARWLTISCSIALLALNLWMGLTPAPPRRLQTTQNYPPLYRADYDEVVRLVAYLRGVAGADSRIYVVDSSATMNSRILRNAETVIHGEQAFLNILHSPQIDSRDFYPLERLLQADYVVITNPVQCHLREDEQRVVRFVHSVFSQSLPPADDFEKMSEEFLLIDGAVLSVYKRQTPADLLSTLAAFAHMKQFIGRVPGGQPDWMSVTPTASPECLYRSGACSYLVSLSNTSLRQSFLYVHTDSVAGHISGDLTFEDKKCGPVQITLDVYAASQSPSLLSEMTLFVSEGAFDLDFSKSDDTALVLTFEQLQGLVHGNCRATLEWEGPDEKIAP